MDRKELEKQTLAYYNSNAIEFKKFRGEMVSLYWKNQLKRFKELLPEGTVLEVGCGIGNEAFLLKEMGYGYLGVDISPTMLEVAKTCCPEGDFVCQDFRNLEGTSSFDGLLAFAALLHLDKDEMTQTLSALRKQLRHGGIGLFTLKKGIGTEVDTKGRFYSYYEPEELAQHFQGAGFEIIEQTIFESKGQTYICSYVKNP